MPNLSPATASDPTSPTQGLALETTDTAPSAAPGTGGGESAERRSNRSAVDVQWFVMRWHDEGRPCIPCEQCGASLRYVVTLQASSGRTMRVGTDCAVTLQGGPELREIRNAEAAWELERLREQWAAEASARAAMDALRAERGQRTLARFAITAEALRRVVAEGDAWERKQCQDLLSQWKRGLSDEPLELDSRHMLGRCLRRIEQARNNQHVGVAGASIELAVTFHRRILPPPGSRFPTMLYQFITDDGAMLVWRTSSFPGALEPGERFLLRGTIKGHETFRETRQTKLLRVKLAPESVSSMT